MAVLLNSKPKTLIRKHNSVLLTWENVFAPDNDSTLIYILEMFDAIDSWLRCYWGTETKAWVQSLASNSIFKFRVKSENVEAKSLSDWVEFKSATNAENYFIKNLTRAITHCKVHALRKIIACRPHFLFLENDQMKFPLMQATENNDFAIVNVLINLGANINQQCSITKRTALMMAIYFSYLNIAKYLLSKGALVNLVDINGKNGLHYAVDSNDLESVEFALENNFLINAKDNQGWTPLIRAIIMEASDDIVKLLLESGADTLIVDNHLFDFKQYASLCGRCNLNIK